MEKIIYGIDIGGTTVKIGTFSDNGKMLNKQEIPTDLSCGGKNILPDIAHIIKEDMTKRSISTKDVAGAGIGVPGPVLEHRIVNRCVNLGWGVTDIAAAFRVLTGIERIPVLNDANAAALGEFYALRESGIEAGTTVPGQYAEPEKPAGGSTLRATKAPEELDIHTPRTMALITIGTGIGCGIIQDGQILPGVFGAAGEIGHIRMPVGEIGHIHMAAGEYELENLAAAAGEFEPAKLPTVAADFELEELAAAGGIVKRMTALAKSGRCPTIIDLSKPLTPKDIAAAAAAGDVCAEKTLEETGAILGIALSYVACVIDPGVFVIGGGISRAGDLLLEPIKKSFARHCFHASSDTSFRLAKLGNDAGICGAAQAVFNHPAIG